MKKIIGEVATLLGSALLLLTVLFTVVQVVMNKDLVSGIFLSASKSDNINTVNESIMDNTTNDNDESAELNESEYQKIDEVEEQEAIDNVTVSSEEVEAEPETEVTQETVVEEETDDDYYDEYTDL